MAFTTGSCWNILRVHLARRNQRPEGGQVSEGAWFSHWRCMALFINFGFFLHSNFYRLSETRRNGVDQAWSTGMMLVLFILGVCTSPKTEGMMISGGRFVRYPFSKSPYLSPSYPSWRPAIQGWALYFVLLFYISFCQPVLWGWRFGLPGIYHVYFFMRLPPDLNIAFCP